MELVAGQTLAAWLAVVAMFVSAGQGLAAAHRAGLVHRDFKPENVLVGSDGRVRVGDFGFATMRQAPGADREPLAPGSLEISRTTTGTVAGTPYYMAPEQFCGQAADARSDQFSFCVALYVAIARAHPFEADRDGPGERLEIEELVAAVTSGRLRKPPGRRVLPRWFRRAGRGDPRAPRPAARGRGAARAGRDRDRRRRSGQAVLAASPQSSAELRELLRWRRRHP